MAISDITNEKGSATRIMADLRASIPPAKRSAVITLVTTALQIIMCFGSELE